MESQVSTAAKHMLINYLEKMAAPHTEAIKQIQQSVKETVESFIAVKSDEVANLVVTITFAGGQICATITAELNERSGRAALYIGRDGEMNLLKHESTEGDKQAAKVIKGLFWDTEFEAYVIAVYAQYVTEYLPSYYYAGAIAEIMKSMEN